MNPQFLPDEQFDELQRLVKTALPLAIGRRESSSAQWQNDVARMLRGDVDRGPLFQTDATDVETDAAMFKSHYPIAEPRQDSLVASVSNIIGKQDPVLVVVEGEPEIREKVENFVQIVLRDCDFPSAVSRAAHSCVSLNTAVLCVSPADDAYMFSYGQSTEPAGTPGITIASIPLTDMVSWGEEVSGIESALMIGHRYTVTSDIAKRYKQDGMWLDRNLMTGRNVSTNQLDQEQYAGVDYGSGTSLGEDSKIAEKTGQPLTVYCLYIRVRVKVTEKEYQWLKVTADESGCIYRIEPHPLDRHPYFTSAFLENPLGDLYPERSIGRQGYELQSIVDNLMTVLLQGAVWSATPALSGEVYGVEDKDIRPMPSEIIPVVDAKALTNQGFNPQAMMYCIEKVERVADQVFRVSQNNLGTSNEGASTATENSIIASGVQSTQEDLLRRFTASMPRMARYICALASLNREAFVTLYGEDDVPLPEELNDPSLLFQVNGMSANQTPQARKMALQEILATLAVLTPQEQMQVDKLELFRQVILNGPLAEMVDKFIPPMEENAIGQPAIDGGPQGLLGGSPLGDLAGLPPEAMQGAGGAMPQFGPNDPSQLTL